MIIGTALWEGGGEGGATCLTAEILKAARSEPKSTILFALSFSYAPAKLKLPPTTETLRRRSAMWLIPGA
jgi:hypothetical protein